MRTIKFRGKDKKPRIRKKGAYKGKIKINDYCYVYSPEHPFKTKHNYVAEHRLIMEDKIGRYLKSNEDVHHIDGNKKNNNKNNLELITHSEHAIKNASDKKRDIYGKFKKNQVSCLG